MPLRNEGQLPLRVDFESATTSDEHVDDLHPRSIMSIVCGEEERPFDEYRTDKTPTKASATALHDHVLAIPTAESSSTPSDDGELEVGNDHSGDRSRNKGDGRRSTGAPAWIQTCLRRSNRKKACIALIVLLVASAVATIVIAVMYTRANGTSTDSSIASAPPECVESVSINRTCLTPGTDELVVGIIQCSAGPNNVIVFAPQANGDVVSTMMPDAAAFPACHDDNCTGKIEHVILPISTDLEDGAYRVILLQRSQVDGGTTIDSIRAYSDLVTLSDVCEHS